MIIALFLLTYTAVIACGGTAVYTFRREGSSGSIARIYYAASFLTLTWCISYLAMYLISDPDLAAIAYKAGAGGWTLNFFLLFRLSVALMETITEKKVSPIPGYLVLFSSVFFLAAALSGKIFASDFVRMPGGWWAERIGEGGFWARAFLAWAAIVYILALIPAFVMLKKARLKRHRRMLLYFISPFSAAAVLSILMNLAFPVFGVTLPPIGHVIVTFFLSFIGYSILKFKMVTPRAETIADPLLFQISDIVILTDGNGTILRANKAVSDLLGYATETIASMGLASILPDILPLKPGTAEREAVARNGGTLPVHCAVTQIDDTHGDKIGYLIILKDLTKVRKLEELTAVLSRSNQELERLCVTDSLTGMFNRNKMESELAHEILRSRRYGSRFSLILYDIDHFKDVNDSFGHAAGDSVLRSISETVRQQNIRETDLLGRWGGEEFLIICVNTEKAAAGALAEKIRTRLALMEHAGVGSVTASFGVTEYAENDTNESIIERVDAAMYDAKHRGRNRTSVF